MISQALKRDFNVDEHFEGLERVGEGTYGVVSRARKKHSKDGKLYALKVTKPQKVSEGLSISACREISLLRELDNEFIIRVQEMHFSFVRQEVWLVFDYAEFDLWYIFEYHRKHKPGERPSEVFQKSAMHQILKGIDYLHSNWVLHRDIKPANILLMGPGPEYGRIKIADLGMARLFHTPLKPLAEVDPVVVTYWYRAPELLLGAKHYTKAIDLWAVGCIMGEMMLTKPLFWVSNDESKEAYFKDQLHAIFNVLGKPVARTGVLGGSSALEWPLMTELPSYHKMYTDFLGNTFEGASLERTLAAKTPPSHSKLSLMSSMLRFDPATRFTAAQALSHPYFSEDPIPNANVFHGGAFQYPARQPSDKGTKAQKPAQPPPPKEPQRSAGAAQSRSSSQAKRSRLQ